MNRDPLPLEGLNQQARRSPTVLAVSVLAVLVVRLGAAAEPAPAPQAEQTDVRLTTLTAVTAGVSDQLKLDLDSATVHLGESSFKLADVLVVDFARPEKRPGLIGRNMLLLLVSGEELLVRPRGGDENEIQFHHPDLGGVNAVELERVRAVVFPDRFRSPAHLLAFKRSLPGWGKPPIAMVEKPWSAAGGRTSRDENPTTGDSSQESEGVFGPDNAEADSENEDDVVITAEGSELRGIVESFERAAVRFEAKSIGPVELAFETIRALRIAQLDAANGAVTDQVEFALTLVDGSFLRGRPLALGDGAVSVHSTALGTVKVPLPVVRHIEISGGRFQFLSDLDPISASTRDLFAHNPVQRDVSYRGGPLRLRGRTYRKGLGMRSHARLDFVLDGKYSRFQATLGIDDEATVTTLEARRSGGGIALFKVWVDHQIAFEKQLSVKDEPLAIDIPVESGQILGIEVDHGPGLYILDYADWVDAKLIKK